MSLEQLLPGGLYKSVLEENSKLITINDGKFDKFVTNIVSVFEAGGSEFARDITYLLVPAVIFSKDIPSERKAGGVLALATAYTLITYGMPLVLRGRNCVYNKLTNWINSWNKNNS